MINMKRIIYLLVVFTAFTLNSVELKAQKTKIKVKDLPENIQDQLNDKYSKYVTKSTIKVQDDKDQVTYEVELQKKNNLLLLEFDESGELLFSEKSHSYTFDGTEPVKKKSNSSDGHSGHSH